MVASQRSYPRSWRNGGLCFGSCCTSTRGWYVSRAIALKNYTKLLSNLSLSSHYHWAGRRRSQSIIWIAPDHHTFRSMVSISRTVSISVRSSHRGVKTATALTHWLNIVQEWKHSCYISCLAPVLDHISQPNMNYDTVLELDKRIRDFAIPASLRDKDINTKSIVMQRASLSTALEAGRSHLLLCESFWLNDALFQIVLLQLHRAFFTRALSGPEEAFNRKHKYAPSVVAVFLSATRMIANIQELYELSLIHI